MTEEIEIDVVAPNIKEENGKIIVAFPKLDINDLTDNMTKLSVFHIYEENENGEWEVLEIKEIDENE